jgi:hypothetical protein
MNLRTAAKGYKLRVEGALGKQVNNASLPAGSPMYFYCKHCGVHTATLPEDYLSTPKRVCDECQALVNEGAMTIVKRWLETHDDSLLEEGK